MKVAQKNHKPKPGSNTQKALRALRRAVIKVRAENRKLGLPMVVWKNGKVVAVRN